MKILITNDDGIDSPGIHELAVQIEGAGYNAIVVAPDHNASGTGTSVSGIASDNPINFETAKISNFSGEVYSVAGAPAFCVLAAYMGAFGEAPDIVVSGINAGLNPGRAVAHSGTIGAGIAGQNFGMRSIAVSVDVTLPWHWSSAAAITVGLLPHLIEGPSHTLLNLNVPGAPLEQIKGVRWASLAPYGTFRGTMIQEKNKLVMKQQPTEYNAEDYTDIGTVKAGYAALTSLHASAEVWGKQGKPGEVVNPEVGIPAASDGQELRPPRATFLPSRYDPQTYSSK